MIVDDKGTTYLYYQSQGVSYEAEITLVKNTARDDVTLVCDFQLVEECVCQEIAEWDEPLQRPEISVLSFCHINNELQKYVELATYEVKIRIMGEEEELEYKEVNVMDFDTFVQYRDVNEE